MQIVEPGIPFSFLTEKSGIPYAKLVPLCQLGELFPWFNYFLLPHHKPLLNELWDSRTAEQANKIAAVNWLAWPESIPSACLLF